MMVVREPGEGEKGFHKTALPCLKTSASAMWTGQNPQAVECAYGQQLAVASSVVFWVPELIPELPPHFHLLPHPQVDLYQAVPLGEAGSLPHPDHSPLEMKVNHKGSPVNKAQQKTAEHGVGKGKTFKRRSKKALEKKKIFYIIK